MKINDYIKGPVSTETEKSLFKNSAESEPFASDWQAWEKAVEQGAEFYDGNVDGIYNPVD